MVTITTIPSLLTCNGSAQPATVALMPNDVRLIASAPDMLAALRDIVAIADREIEPFIRARAAIAAAEGR